MSTLFILVSEGWVGLGLDMRFLGEKWQKKNKGGSNSNRISRLVLRATLQPCTPTSKSACWRPRLRQSGAAFAACPDAGLKRSRKKSDLAWIGWSHIHILQIMAPPRRHPFKTIDFQQAWMPSSNPKEADFSAAPLTMSP
jgi:hypothetical protein